MIILRQRTYSREKCIIHQICPSESPISILNSRLILLFNTSSSLSYILRQIECPTALFSTLGIKLPFNDLTSKVVVPIWMTDTVFLEVKDFSYFLLNNVHSILGDLKIVIGVQQNIFVDPLAMLVS